MEKLNSLSAHCTLSWGKDFNVTFWINYSNIPEGLKGICLREMVRAVAPTVTASFRKRWFLKLIGRRKFSHRKVFFNMAFPEPLYFACTMTSIPICVSENVVRIFFPFDSQSCNNSSSFSYGGFYSDLSSQKTTHHSAKSHTSTQNFCWKHCDVWILCERSFIR